MFYKLFSATSVVAPDPTIREERNEDIELPGGTVTLHRIPSSAFVVEGLSDAVRGDLTGLAIRASNRLLVKGQDDFVAFYITGTRLVLGGLEERDPFEGARCPFHQKWSFSRFTLSTAVFEMGRCGSWLRSSPYEIVFVAVEDSSPELAEADRRRFELPTKADVDCAMTYRFNHHYSCDSFHLVLPHAEYAATAAAMPCCGPTIPEAPQREDGEFHGIRYRLRHRGHAWLEGTVPECDHHFYCE